MAIDLTSTEALLLITDLILIIIVVYLVDRLRKIKKNTKTAEEKQSLETAVPLEVKPDLSVVKINKPEKAELKPGDGQTVLASPVNTEPAPEQDELEDRLLEELHAIPSEVKSETETKEPGILKLEDEPPGENPAGTVLGDAKPGKVRKPRRKKRSKSKKAADSGEAAQTVNGETKPAAGKKAGRKKKVAEQAGQIVEVKPAQEIVKEENADAVVKVEKAEEIVKEEKPEVPVEEKKPEELKDSKKDSLF
ncbi:hypothetical protein [Candidatus Methanoperedens nitratireducens]|uniref:Uncharacterized protein n=1 Tax=Candidatus Methanoperedens nitratireducens TaxID=1392998 RepID=A0A284VN19_9EURY|nr:hypothetical protein [Candidatus Methanoperedens nitroreducens]SNQ60603.1 hypothetical protein MNV_1950005 [Candidatus Methanoperedens nitroreducens]